MTEGATPVHLLGASLIVRHLGRVNFEALRDRPLSNFENSTTKFTTLTHILSFSSVLEERWLPCSVKTH
jgi:hypothetical protein